MSEPLPFPATACHALDAAALPLTVAPLDAGLVITGTPDAGSAELVAGPGLTVGVWEHTAGSSRDVEADEVFVVLSGRATVEVEGGPALELGPGTLAVLAAGSRTTWTVHEALRKVYIVTG